MSSLELLSFRDLKTTFIILIVLSLTDDFNIHYLLTLTITPISQMKKLSFKEITCLCVLYLQVFD